VKGNGRGLFTFEENPYAGGKVAAELQFVVMGEESGLL